MSSPDTDTPVPDGAAAIEAPPVDERRDALVAALGDARGEGLVEHHVAPGVDVWARVDAGAWVDAARTLRDRCAMTYFNFLSAIDWQPSPDGRDRDAQGDQEPGDAEADAEMGGAWPGEVPDSNCWPGFTIR